MSDIVYPEFPHGFPHMTITDLFDNSITSPDIINQFLLKVPYFIEAGGMHRYSF